MIPKIFYKLKKIFWMNKCLYKKVKKRNKSLRDLIPKGSLNKFDMYEFIISISPEELEQFVL